MFNLYPVSLAMRARVSLFVMGAVSTLIAYFGVYRETPEVWLALKFAIFIIPPIAWIISASLLYQFGKELVPSWIVTISIFSFLAIVLTVSGYYDPHPNAFLKAIAFLPHACWLAIFIIAKWAITGKVYRNVDNSN